MRLRRSRVSALVFGVVGLALLAFTAPAGAALDKCQGGIQKYVVKLNGKILKGLTKCADGYRKAVVKNLPLTGPTGPAAKCNGELNKAIVYPDLNLIDGVSAMQAAKDGLNKLVTVAPLACTDEDLTRLGHLPAGTFGDMWQRWAMLTALQSTYEQQTWETSDTLTILTALNATGDCPLCAKLITPPCFKHNCVLGGGSGATTFLPGPIAVALTGETVFEICSYGDLTGTDFMVIGNPSKTIEPTTVLGINVCTTGIRASGYIRCGATPSPKVNVTLCQDHTVQAGVDECEPATVCQPDTADTYAAPHNGLTNGGACATLTPLAPAAGNAFVLSTTQIRLVPAANVGVDGIPCTPDDTGPPAAANTIQLTTGNSSATVVDANDSEGSTIPTGVVTGSPFNCSTIPTSNLSPGKLVGSFPALHALCIVPPCDDPLTPGVEGPVPLDSATTFALVCS